MREGQLLAVATISAICCLFIGVGLAIWTGEAECVSRSGAAIVCIEGVVAITEHRMKSRIKKAEKEMPSNPYIEHELMIAERTVFVLAVSLAIIGEFIHGFGDIIYAKAVYLIGNGALI